jgi:photosystem II stability/assembly factor-like uncharacterized protein
MNRFIHLTFIPLILIISACHKSTPVTPATSKTTQINSHWTVANTNASNSRVMSIQFISADTGFFLGYDKPSGFIFLSKTTDGGLNWNLLKTFTNYNQSFICFYALSSSKISVARDGIYLSNDGGNNFSFIPNTSLGVSFFQLYFLNISAGFAITADRIYQSADMQTWTSAHVLSHGSGYNIICFPDQLNGYIGGGYTGIPIAQGPGISSSVLSKTTDGGKTWQDLFTGVGDPHGFHNIVGMSFINADTGWLLTDDGKLIHTPDAGDTWVTVNPTLSTFGGSLLFQTTQRGFYIANGNVYSTIDGGVSFTKDYVTNLDLYSISNGKNGKAYISGDNGLILIESN